jgi:uncharacterized protein YegJ (DUF2314 family)
MTIVNVEERNAENPETFGIPDLHERQSMEIGAYVKVIFEEDDGCGERMWVKITRVIPGRYEGILSNTPIVVDMAMGDTVEFGPENIADILPL